MSPLRVVSARTFGSLRVRNYRLYFIGQLVSNTGTWMQTVAQSWLVLQLTDSGSALGLTVGLQFLPLLLFGVWGGLIADRVNKRRALIATQATYAALAVTLWALVATHNVDLWMVYVLAFALGCVTVVDLPTRQAFVTEMVGPDQLPNAIGLNSAVFNAARLLGPAAAGLVIDRAGVAPAFVVNALSFLAVIGGLVAMRPHELFRDAPAPRERGQIRAGLRYVWEHPVLRSTLVMVTLVATFGFNFIVILPVLARHTFHGGARLYGTLSALMGLGSVIGALAVAGHQHPTRRVLVGSAVGFGLLTLLTAEAPTPLTAGILLVAVGASLIVFIATANSMLQLTAESTMRGRVMAIYGLVFLGSTPVGGPLLGWISQHWDARAGLAFSGAISLAAGLVALGTGRRQGAGAPRDVSVATVSS
jgi:MFS family permease